jgi:hypothetical protein
MGLDLWFREDLQRILASKVQAVCRVGISEYRQGYLDCIRDLAVEFGIATGQARPPELEARWQSPGS